MYECPNCGQNLKFDISRQAMHCDYCDTVMDPYAIVEKHTAKEVIDPAYTGEPVDVSTTEGEGEPVPKAPEPVTTMQVSVYTCPQCGGEIVGDVNEAMVFCSFCGASTPLNQRMANIRRPEVIIPFTKTKEDCAREYKNLLKKAIFAPKELRDPKNISGFRAIYMPYWIYDFTKIGPASYKGEHCYRRGNYDYTDHYTVTTSVDMEYDGVNYDASSSFSDNLSQAISPYDAKQARPFTTAFMSGFYADTMDVDAAVYEKEAKDVVCEHAGKMLEQGQKSSVYSIKHETVKTALSPITNKKTLAMFPVWFMSYKTTDKKGRERVLYSVINGQSGKAAADLPVDIRRYLIGSIILALPIFLLFNIILQLTPLALTVIAAVISTICMISLWAQSSVIAKKEFGSDDAGASSAAANKKEYKAAAKKREQWEAKSVWKANRFFFLIPIILCGLMILFKPVHDYTYYAVVVISGVCNCFMLTDIMRRYNKLASRPLPQFNRKGGDDSANITGNI